MSPVVRLRKNGSRFESLITYGEQRSRIDRDKLGTNANIGISTPEKITFFHFTHQTLPTCPIQSMQPAFSPVALRVGLQLDKCSTIGRPP